MKVKLDFLSVIFLLMLVVSKSLVPGQTISNLMSPEKEEVLLDAAKNDNVDLIERSNNVGIDIFFQASSNGKTLAHSSAEYNSINTLKFLLEKIDSGKLKAFIDAKDIYGNSALHIATFKNHKKIVELLLQQPEIIIQTKNNKGNTPLHIAALENYIYILDLFLNKKLGVNIQNKNGNTPLHLAASNNSNYTLKRLLEKKETKINAKNNNGNTPLHLAVEYNAFDTMKTLLENSEIDLQIKNKNGKTAEDLARQNDTKVLNHFKSILKNKLENEVNKIETKLQKIKTNLNELILKKEFYSKYLEQIAMKREDIRTHQVKLSSLAQQKESIKKSIQNIEIKIKSEENLIENIKSKLETATNELKKIETESAIKIQKAYRNHLLTSQLQQFMSFINRYQPKLKNYNEKLKEQALYVKQLKKLKEQIIGQINLFAKFKDKNGNTILHLFATCGLIDKKIIKKFTKYGGDINWKNNNGQTALWLSILYGYDENVKNLLLSHSASQEPDKNKITPLHLAILTDTSKYILDPTTGICRNNSTIIDWIISDDLINTRDSYGYTPLDYAINLKKSYLIKNHLLKKLNIYNEQENKNNFIYKKIPKKKLKKIMLETLKFQDSRYIKENVIKIQRFFRSKKRYESGNTIIHELAKYGRLNKQKINDFVKDGCNINSQNHDGQTALHISILNGYDAQTDLLMSVGADITITNNDNETPLHYAIATHNNETFLTQDNKYKQRDNTKLIKSLINEQTIKMNDVNGNTALHWAAYSGHEDLIEVLVKNGANIDIQNNEGGTPVHLASVKNNPETVSKLIELGANVLIKDKNIKKRWFDKKNQRWHEKGHTAWDYVKDKKGFEDVENILDKKYLSQCKNKKIYLKKQNGKNTKYSGGKK